MTQMHKHNPLKNNKGILTLDFIFAMLIMFAFSAILFAFSITFSAVEVAQYATFAASRAYFSANKNSDDQEAAGRNKFNELIVAERAPLGNFFKNGWFTLSPIEFKNYNEDYNAETDSDQDTFVGARTTIVAKLLQLRVPLLGSTTEEDLSAVIGSYLMREPTEEECSDFVRDRFSNILNLDSRFSSGPIQQSAYAIIMDDGC